MKTKKEQRNTTFIPTTFCQLLFNYQLAPIYQLAYFTVFNPIRVRYNFQLNH